MIPGRSQTLADIGYMLSIACFHLYTQDTAVDLSTVIVAFMRYRYHITAETGYHSAYARQLPRLVEQIECKRTVAATLYKTAHNNTV